MIIHNLPGYIFTYAIRHLKTLAAQGPWEIRAQKGQGLIQTLWFILDFFDNTALVSRLR